MTSFADQARRAHVARRSIGRLRDIVRAGTLPAFSAVDRTTGEVIDPEARALFASLPAVTPATTPDELVSHGLLSKVPNGLSGVYEKPRYRPGRQLFVRTSVSHKPRSARHPVGCFDPNGEVAFTHRAVLRGRRDEDFLVELEGADELLPFAQADVFAWNEPCAVRSSGGTISGVQVDYNEPRFKAFICAGFLRLFNNLAELDFDADAATLRQHQVALVQTLATLVSMHYAGQGDGYAGNRAGSLIEGGQGVCFVQRAVAGAFLHVFARTIAFEVQLAVGRTLALGAPHGFVVVTLLPSMERYVCDPAWSEPLTSLPVAFFGPSWGHDRRLEGFEGDQDLVVRMAEIELPEMG